MDRKQVLQIFKEYSSIFTVVEDDDVDRVYLADNFDRHGISDYVFKIEHYINDASEVQYFAWFKVVYYADRDVMAGADGRSADSIIRLEELTEDRLRKQIRRTLSELSRLKLNLRRNLVEGL